MRFTQMIAAAIAGSVIMGAAQLAHAGAAATSSLTFRLQLPGGGTAATVSDGTVEHLEIWVDIAGQPQTGLYDAGGSFVTGSSAVNHGDFSNPTLLPSFAGNGSQLGLQSDIDGDGDLDWGSSDPFSTPSFYYARTSRKLPDNTPLPVVGSSLQLGTIDFTVTHLTPGQSLSLTFVPRDRSGAPDQLWTTGYVSDASPGTPVDDTTNPLFIGAPVVLSAPVPEPASLSLLALGAAGLLARRRR